ncbi:maleylpyruvate isomerase family mycothiol-dependent enzyme [Saccharothrix sp. AJ9571]|nr:maleylpyruvate isomerase family mycothiol-dependent enzyme [Saccharothrix sp. AJ9571]
MRREQIMGWVKDERLSLADLLEGLSQQEWDVRSLCEGWTVRDVAAHLSLSTRMTIRLSIRGAIRARGNVHRMFDLLARERANQFTPQELVAQIRETAGSTHLTPGASPLDPLIDMLVHGQDIARPLGRPRPMPLDAAVAALDHAWSSRFYGAQKRLRGHRLVATDREWTGEAGAEEIRGPVADLLLLATGRKLRAPAG